MQQGRILLTAIATLGVFGLGYLAGSSGKTNTSKNPSSASSTSPHATHDNAPSPSNTHSKPKPRNAKDDPVPTPEKGFSRRIVAMMAAGELGVNEVAIDSDRLLPGAKVQAFLDLTDDQLETMKRMGHDRLQAKQAHERSIAKTIKSTADEIIIDIPADPAFATAQKEAFIEDLRKQFGPDVAAVLQTSIAQAYSEFTFPRHVHYTESPGNDLVPPDAPEEIRRMIEGRRNYNTSINRNENGTYMTDAHGSMIPGGTSYSGSYHPNDTRPYPVVPRYHYLLKHQQSE